jgi:hypothetical protein
MLRLLPRWTGGGLWSILSPTSSAAFPVVGAGQRPQRRCRGLLRLHSRCGLRACSTSFQGPLSQGFAVAVTHLPSSGFSAPDSYRGVPTELPGRDFRPLERCTLMAHLRHRPPPRDGGDVLLLDLSRETDPPRAPCDGHVASAGLHCDPCVLSKTYGSGAVPRERSSAGLPPRRYRCSRGSPSARTGGTARTGSRSAGSVGVGAPLPRAGGNSTAASSLRIISTETNAAPLRWAIRCLPGRPSHLCPAPKRPPSRKPTPLFGVRYCPRVTPGSPVVVACFSRAHPGRFWRALQTIPVMPSDVGG